MRAFAIVIGIIASFAIGGLSAAFLIGQFDSSREQATVEQILMTNQILLDNCRGKCSENEQRLLITENDLALYQLQWLESADAENVLYRTAGRLFAAALAKTSTAGSSKIGSRAILASYTKMSCGLQNVLCMPSSTK
jgi:hypothetical protein